ncbi:MAG TPA: adenylate/guanylate cyclase domain-containing protein [Pleomorphomonadaceae bacterium]|nr:adenylate/guanylate cyclase domain-containing protein [Pleomorphomonadaceae bacterium]
MPALPTGTLTFLFTDIESSTRVLETLGDAYRSVLERHHTLLREAIAAGEGTEVSTEGDAFFAVFPSAPKAVAAVAQAQRALAVEPWPEGAAVRVRMGLHTGEGVLGGDSYVGLDVHRAARVASASHGGQVLLSGATQALTAGGLPPGVSLVDLGQHRLKDLSRPEHLWQIAIDGLPASFPALRTLDATPNNLPLQLTSFLGRQREVSDVLGLLSEHRLVTLTGPGGTGKTRLALQVAAEASDRYPDGVYFVALEPITRPELLLPTVAQAMGLMDPGAASVDRLAEHFGERAFLLVLDNFEQVDAAAPLVGELLARAPRLSVLATSRSPLRVYGERESPVPPLGLPDPRHLPELEQFTQFESVALFIERAVAVRPDFRVSSANAPAVAEVCVRLDGLPLAIELAAARVRVLTPQAILDRLSDRLGLLSGGARDLPARQQTLRGAIAWSHDLLEDDDKRVFACLSVFAGGSALEQIEEVCFEAVNRHGALDVVSSLVDKSLLREESASGAEPRFRMLETIRQFGAEQLAASGDAEIYRQRHAASVLAFVERGAEEVMGDEGGTWLDRYELDRDNIRAAFGWAIESGATEIALRLLAACWRYWQMRGYLAEARGYADRALALPDATEHPKAREAALEAAGGIAYWQGDHAAARVWYEETLDMARARHDDRAEANAIYNLTFTYTWDPVEQKEAGRLVDEGLAVNRRLGDPPGIARALWARAGVYYYFKDIPAAAAALDESLAIFRDLGDRFMIAWTLYMRALALLREDQARADEALREALDIFRQTDDVTGYALVFDAFAAVAAITGDTIRAMRLAGFAAATEKLAGTGLGALNREYADFHPEKLVAERDEYAAAYAEGQQMDLDRAIRLALREE